MTVPFQPGMHGGSNMNYIDRTELSCTVSQKMMCILILNYLQYVGPARGEKKVVYKIRHLHPHSGRRIKLKLDKQCTLKSMNSLMTPYSIKIDINETTTFK